MNYNIVKRTETFDKPDCQLIKHNELTLKEKRKIYINGGNRV